MTAALATYDIVIDLTTGWARQMRWTQPDQLTGIDLTNWTAQAMIRADVTDTTPIAAMTVALDADGNIDLRVPASAITTIDDGTLAWWDLLLTPPAGTGDPVRLVGGNALFENGATH
jgi:hypothetical protein